LLNHYNDYFKKKFTEILSKQKKITYKSSGVDVNLGYKLVDIIKPFAKKTLRKEIDSNIGSFAALASIPKKL
jgi:phosphoribosylformylglycinamidine cyclo-ligase